VNFGALARTQHSGYERFAVPSGLMRTFFAAACLLAVVLSIGCGWFDNPSEPDTVAPAETFSGTLAPQGANVFTFTVKQAGTVSVTLTNLTPASTVGLGLGTPTGSGNTTNCVLSTFTNDATAGAAPQITTTGQPGSLCVRVYDAGKVTASVAFTINVVHP
jgi:hypothetical protein